MLKKLFKPLSYGIYMIYFKMKGLKYNYLKYSKGNDTADYYTMKCAYLWSIFTLKTIEIDLDVQGTDSIPDGNFVLIGNHSSILDIPIIFSTISLKNRKLAFIAKKEILKAPIIGRWMKRTASVALDRDNPRSALKSIQAAIESLKNGWTMVIFPEGTRNKDGKVGEFKKGSLKLATKSNLPIVPVSIDRASRCFEDNHEFRPAKIKVVYGNPIYTENLSKEEKAVLHETVRDIIIKNLEN